MTDGRREATPIPAVASCNAGKIIKLLKCVRTTLKWLVLTHYNETAASHLNNFHSQHEFKGTDHDYLFMYKYAYETEENEFIFKLDAREQHVEPICQSIYTVF